MELFGLHIPDALVTAAVVLYWIAVFVGLMACVMRGWLWGKWRWYLLSMFGSLSVCAQWFTGAEAVFGVPFFACLLFFVFKKWKKLNVSPVEYFLMAFFTFPMAGALILLLLFVWVEILGNRL